MASRIHLRDEDPLEEWECDYCLNEEEDSGSDSDVDAVHADNLTQLGEHFAGVMADMIKNPRKKKPRKKFMITRGIFHIPLVPLLPFVFLIILISLCHFDP